MPSVFLSPATQEHGMQGYREYALGGSEAELTNEIVNAMEPYLLASEISFGRNDPAERVSVSVDLSNAGHYDLYLAIRVNTAPESMTGRIQGTDIFFYPSSTAGKRFAQLIAKHMEAVYPYPDLVGTTPNNTLFELRKTKAPAALVKVAYRDNYEDAYWIVTYLEKIARALANAIAQYFALPLAEPEMPNQSRITTDGFSVNLRNEADWCGTPILVVPNGAKVSILEEQNGWVLVEYDGVTGFVNKTYLSPQ